MSRNTLSIVEKTRLAALIEEQYETSGMNDHEFAKHAMAFLDIPAISAATVATYRKAYGIPAAEVLTLTEARARIRELEAHIISLKAA